MLDGGRRRASSLTRHNSRLRKENKIRSMLRREKAGLVTELAMLLPLMVVCALLVVFVVKERAPGEVIARSSVQGHTEPNQNVVVAFDPASHDVELWMKLDMEHETSPNHATPLVDGYISLFVHDRICPYGVCAEVVKYDVALSVKQACHRCKYTFSTGEIENNQRRIQPSGTLVPERPGRIQHAHTTFSTRHVQSELFLTKLPDMVRAHHNCTLVVDLATHVAVKELDIWLARA